MTDSQQTLHQVADLFEFFRDELSSAFEKLGVATSDETRQYLIRLLESFVRIDEHNAEQIGFDRPAAFILGDALNSAGDRRIEAYRRLGDASLFSCGFFEDHLDRSDSVVPLEYYRDMGRNAYASLESLMQFKAPGGAFHMIFDELTSKFDNVVEAFQLLGNRRDDPSYSRLVEQWQNKGEIDVDAWNQLGVLPSGGEGDV